MPGEVRQDAQQVHARKVHGGVASPSVSVVRTLPQHPTVTASALILPPPSGHPSSHEGAIGVTPDGQETQAHHA
jgi:hypothetical protein